jgi:BMFP domain-containing protein YqiC
MAVAGNLVFDIVSAISRMDGKVSFTLSRKASLTTSGGSPAGPETPMQTRNPILDEFAKLTTGAMGLAQAAGEEAKAAFRSQTDRMAAELDLVRRDEFDALKAEVAALRAELVALKTVNKPETRASTDGTPAGDAAG